MIGNIWISSKRLEYWLWLPTITIWTLSYKDTLPDLRSCSYTHVLYRWGGQRYLLRLLTSHRLLDALSNLKCTKYILKQTEVHCLKITDSEEKSPNLRFTLTQNCHLQISRFHESSRWWKYISNSFMFHLVAWILFALLVSILPTQF